MTDGELVLGALEDAGFSQIESIRALVEALIRVADHDDRLLDLAANLLAEGEAPR